MAAFACPRCRRFYRVKTVGITWEEGRPLSDGTWTSYKLWKGDLLECEGCGSQIIRPAGQPFVEHSMPEYATVLPEAIVRIDDCPGTFSAERALEIRQAAASTCPTCKSPRIAALVEPNILGNHFECAECGERFKRSPEDRT